MDLCILKRFWGGFGGRGDLDDFLILAIMNCILTNLRLGVKWFENAWSSLERKLSQIRSFIMKMVVRDRSYMQRCPIYMLMDPMKGTALRECKSVSKDI